MKSFLSGCRLRLNSSVDTPKAGSLLLLALLLFALPVWASEAEAPKVKELIDSETQQVQTKGEATPPKAIPADKFDRGTPRSTVLALAEALRERNFELVMNYMDMRNVPHSVRRQGEDLARQFKIIVDRSFWTDIETISNEPEGRADDGLPSHREIITRLKTPDGPVDVLLQRVPGDTGEQIWKLSRQTVADIPKLYQHYGYGKYGDRLSRLFPDVQILGMELWQWVMLVLIAVPAFIASWGLTYLLKKLVALVRKGPRHRIDRFLSKPVRFAVFVLIVRGNFDLLSPTHAAQAVFEARTFLILAIVWVINGGIELGFGRLSDRMRANGNEHATVLLRPATTLLKVTIWLVAFISWLDNLGFNVTTMIAGLGVGGVAVGLAAQKSIENLIGAITIYAAEPIRIGDFCKAGDTLGIVEEIGLRFTTLRTLDRTLVTIPNASLANTNIENYTRRDKILYRRTLRLRNDSSPDQIRAVLDGVREMMESHPEVDPVPARARFTEYGEHSLNLDIFTYIKTTDFNRYLEIVEDLNLKILDIVAAAGTRLALPARSVRFEEESAAA